MQLWTDEIEAMRPEARAVVDAGMALVAEAFASDGEPPKDLLGQVQQMRRTFERTFAPLPEAIVRDIAGVSCRTFLPDGPASAVYVHFHGGGMVIGAPEMGDTGNLDLSRRFGMAVVSVGYRKAPEHPFPAGPDDGIAVVKWVIENGIAEYGSNRIIVGGESAGGYMAAAVALRMRDELNASDNLIGANLVFGVHDWGRSPSQRGVRVLDGPDLLTPEGMAMFGDCYLPGMSIEERRSPNVSPLFADLQNLCPAFMSVGTADHLLDDTLMLAPRWAAAGNEVELFVAPEMPHGFQAFPCGITSAWAAALFDWFARLVANQR
jgi:acetyl esterase/lipase